MNTEEFVKAYKMVVADAAIEDSISVFQKPPGRKPSEELLQISNYYNGLNRDERKIIDMIIARVSYEASFGALCVLDGVRSIEEEGDKGDINLVYSKDNRSFDLNKNKDLHDIFNFL
ncbi:hypothetical protein V6243_14350 [Cobetia marina]|uniref:Uncharacterized protein n=1 Tax=Cobetia marina TaxID=28258 RepID=A0ABU9GIQ6_COBMA